MKTFTGFLLIVVVGICFFTLLPAQEQDRLRDILIEETTSLGLMAMQYFKKPAEIGGGSKSFLGWTIPLQMVTTANGNFMTSTVSSDQVIIIGTGTEVVTGTDSIEVQTTVTADEVNSIIIN